MRTSACRNLRLLTEFWTSQNSLQLLPVNKLFQINHTLIIVCWRNKCRKPILGLLTEFRFGRKAPIFASAKTSKSRTQACLPSFGQATTRCIYFKLIRLVKTRSLRSLKVLTQPFQPQLKNYFQLIKLLS